MKRISILLLISTIWFSCLGQTLPPDRTITQPVPATGANINKVSDRYANLKAYRTFYVPKFASNSLQGGKDSVGAIMYNTTVQKLVVYKGSGVWEELGGGNAYTAGYGLNLTGFQFKADTTLLGTKSWVNGRLLSYAPISPSGSYVQLSPSSPQSGFINLSVGLSVNKGGGEIYSYDGKNWENHLGSKIDLGGSVFYYAGTGNHEFYGNGGAPKFSFTGDTFKIYTTPTTDATPTQILTRDATTGEVKKIDASSLGGVTSVTSANSNISVANTTTTPILTLAGTITSNTSGNAATATNVAFSGVTSKPTTLSGYGITDAYPLTGNPSGFITSSALTPYQLLSEKGNAGGYASLDGSGRVPLEQLPSGTTAYVGTWNASTNTPTLANGTGIAGNYYIVNIAGTQNLGSGSIAYAVGDNVIYNGTVWDRIPNSGGVTSVNGMTGSVSLTTTDIPEGTNLYYTEAKVNANTNVAANTSARHNAVTLGTANGLSLSGQQLSLGLASTSSTGALSDTDWDTFNNKIGTETDPTVPAYSKTLSDFSVIKSSTDALYPLKDGVNNIGLVANNPLNPYMRQSSTNNIIDLVAAASLGTNAYTSTPYYPASNPNGYISSVPAQSFASLTGKPTTLSGYGITDAYPLTGNPSGFLTTVPNLQQVTTVASTTNTDIEISGTGDKTFTVQTNTSGSPSINLIAGGSDGSSIKYDRSTSQLRVSNSSATNAFNISSDGNVGVGTTTTTAKLNINGAIRASNNDGSATGVVRNEDLAGKANLSGGNTFTGAQNIIGNNYLEGTQSFNSNNFSVEGTNNSISMFANSTRMSNIKLIGKTGGAGSAAKPYLEIWPAGDVNVSITGADIDNSGFDGLVLYGKKRANGVSHLSWKVRNNASTALATYGVSLVSFASADREFLLPDASGTVALTSDLGVTDTTTTTPQTASSLNALYPTAPNGFSATFTATTGGAVEYRKITGGWSVKSVTIL